MAVLKALRPVPRTLLRNPVLFVPLLAVTALQVPQLALRPVSPLLSSLVSALLSLVSIVVMPFVQAGLVGMADEALDGRTSLRTFVDEGVDHYVSVLLAYLGLMALNFVLGAVAFFVAVAGGLVYLGGDGLGSAGVAVLAVIGVVVAAAVLAYLLVTFFVQFYGQAIVLEDRGVVGGVERSLSVVRHSLVSTFGYTLLNAVVGLLAGAVFGGASVLLSTGTATQFGLPEPTLPVVAGVVLLVALGGTLLGGFFAVFSVSFYRTVAGDAGGDDEDQSASDDPDDDEFDADPTTDPDDDLAADGSRA